MAMPSCPFPSSPPHDSTLRLYNLETQRMPTEPLPIDTFGYDPEDPHLFVRISKRFVYKQQTESGPSQLYDSPTPPNVNQLAFYGDPLDKTSRLVYTGPEDNNVPLLGPEEVPFATIATTGLVLPPPARAKEHPIIIPPTPPRTPNVAQEAIEEGAAPQFWETKTPFRRKHTPYPDQIIDLESEEAELVYPEPRSSQTGPDRSPFKRECTPHPFPPNLQTVDSGGPSEPALRQPFRRECTPYPHPYPQRTGPPESEAEHATLVHRRNRTHRRRGAGPRPPPFTGQRPPFVFPPRPCIDHGEPGPSGSDSISLMAPQPVLDSEMERTPYDQAHPLALTYPPLDPEHRRPAEPYSHPDEVELGLNYTYYPVGDSEPQGEPISTAEPAAAAAAQIDASEAPTPIIIVIPAKVPRSTPLPVTRTQQVMDCVYRLVELLGSGDVDGEGNHDPNSDGHNAAVGIAASSNSQQKTQAQTQNGKGKRKRSEDQDHDRDEHRPEHSHEVEAQAVVPFSESLLGRTQTQREMRPRCACCTLPTRSDDDRLRKRARIEDWLSGT